MDASGKYVFVGGHCPAIFVLRLPPADGRASSGGAEAPATGKEPPAAASEKPTAAPAEITNSIGMKLKLIKPGRFLMGSPKEEQGREDKEGPQHEIEITRAFYMGACSVTKAQFAAFVKDGGYQTDAERDGKGGFGFNTTTALWERKPEYTWQHPGFSQGDDHPVVEVKPYRTYSRYS